MIEPITSETTPDGALDQQQDGLQAHFKPNVSVDEIEQVYHLKRAQPLLQVFTALFHGGFDGVLVRLLVLRELASDTSSSTFSRADINTRLAYLLPESLETVLMRLRSNQLLAWDAQQAVYRVTPMARNVLSAIDGLLALGNDEDEADMGFLLSQVAGAQVMGGVGGTAAAPAGPSGRSDGGILRCDCLRFGIPPARFAGQMAYGLRLGGKRLGNPACHYLR